MPGGMRRVAHRLLIVDDHPVVIDGVRQNLASQPEFEVVGEATGRESATTLAARLRPDVILLDLSLDGVFAHDLCRTLIAAAPGARVLIHTAFHDPEPLQACMDAGAFGVVFKDGRDLLPALHSVIRGSVFLQPSMFGPRRSQGVGPVLDAVEQLSPRELEVLSALALGHSTQDIADALHLTVNTVRSYIKTLLAKLHATSRVEALAIARRNHLL